jgi:hypothetical protein
MHHKNPLPQNKVNSIAQSRGYWNIKISNKISNREKRISLQTDNQLLDFILKQMGTSLNETRTELVRFIKEALNMDSNYPKWVSKIVNDNYNSILSSIKEEETLFNIEFLTIACYFFKLRIEISYADNAVQRFKGFGDKRYRRFAFILRDGEYIEKGKVHKIQNQHLPEDSKKREEHRNRMVEKNSENFNIMNTMGPALKHRSMFTYKNISNYNELPLNTSIHYSEGEDEDQSINKVYQQTEFRTESPKEMGLNNMSRSYSFEEGPLKKEDKKYEDTLQTALNFIKQYQMTVKTTDVNNNIDKKYKSVVLGKSDKFYEGTLKFYNEQKKFGFILLANDKEIFIHKDNIVRSKIDTRAFAICSHFFTIILKFRLLHYQGKRNSNIKAIDLEILNFVPKTATK